jgi:hypothetical protein
MGLPDLGRAFPVVGDFPLPLARSSVSSSGMEYRVVIGVVLGIVLLNGCREEAEVTVRETRPLSTRDAPPRLFATSDERFSNARPSPVKGETPSGWTALPGNEFRLLNYRFGPSGTGEVWVSTAAGTVRENVNRWLRQFGAPPLDEAGFKALPTLPLLGTTGVLVKAEGEYVSGMGQPPQPGFGLSGVVTEFQGQILTVKMVGPAAEVRFGQPALEAFAKGLHPVE